MVQIISINNSECKYKNYLYKTIINIVLMGFVTSVIDLTGVEAMRSAVRVSVPRGAETLNTNAFNRGYEFGQGLERP
jgi:Pyruvate/2-oxoacid:ferredoxin oxidoreductase gamma subunit